MIYDILFQVSVEFSLYVSGYQKNLSTTGFLLDNNPDLELVSEPLGLEKIWPERFYHLSQTWGRDCGQSLFHCQFPFSDLGPGWWAEFEPGKHFNAPASAELAALQGFGE